MTCTFVCVCFPMKIPNHQSEQTLDLHVLVDLVVETFKNGLRFLTRLPMMDLTVCLRATLLGILLATLLPNFECSGDLRISERVSWTSLRKFRDESPYCESEFELFQDNKRWDFCSDVSADQFGGDYRKHQIPTPNEVSTNPCFFGHIYI